MSTNDFVSPPHSIASRLRREGYFLLRVLPTGEIAGLQRFIYTVGLCVGLDDLGYRTRFCYPDLESAASALMNWDGEADPPGVWIKEKGAGERVNPLQLRGIPITLQTSNHDALLEAIAQRFERAHRHD